MTQRIYTDRSRVQTADRCKRRRLLEYHWNGTGIVPSRMPLPLAVGIAEHAGQAVLVWDGQQAVYKYGDVDQVPLVAWREVEDNAVHAALLEFSQFSQSMEVDTTESAAMQPTPAADVFQQQVVAQARELGMDEGAIAGLARDPAVARSEFDRYLAAEQAALVEGMVRAYARRRLQPLLSQFEVLEVEREGEWKLSEVEHDWGENEFGSTVCLRCGQSILSGLDRATNKPVGGPDRVCYELWFMSCPDALLRERQSNELYVLSYKTTATWDVRKARDIEHDMQGLSEGVEVERRLGEWWQQIDLILRDEDKDFDLLMPTEGGVRLAWYAQNQGISMPILRFLAYLAAPPRIHAIRYEFLLKGYRAEDKELSARLGITAWTQRSHLVRQYVATSVPKKGDGGYRVGDVAWSWNYFRVEDDKDSKLAWQNWHSRPVWEGYHVRSGEDLSVHEVPGDGVKAWIDALDASELLMSGEDSTVGLAPRTLGWKSPAQAMGVTKEHPLDAVFTIEGLDGRPTQAITVWRSDDDLRDWVESTEAQERRVAAAVALVNASSDPGERRSLLNIHFHMNRTACEYPSTCPFVKVCYAGAEMKADPLAVGAGMFKRRIPNHPAEAK